VQIAACVLVLQDSPETVYCLRPPIVAKILETVSWAARRQASASSLGWR